MTTPPLSPRAVRVGRACAPPPARAVTTTNGGHAVTTTNGGRAATASVDEQVIGEIDEAVEVDRPWVVIVWNDPINLMSYVTFVFQKLFGYSLEKATELMLDVHEKGRASVFTGTREEAELHVFRLHEHSLWATMQQDT